MTETSELSDYVIAPALPYEKPDIAALRNRGNRAVHAIHPAVLPMRKA